MPLRVYERADETLMVASDRIQDDHLPRSCGDLACIGVSDVDLRSLSPWVASRVEDAGVCAVVGDDALLVRRRLVDAHDAPPSSSPMDLRWARPIG